MNRWSILFAVATLLCSTVACQRESISENIDNEHILTFAVDIDDTTRIDFSEGKFAWEGGEELGVYIDATLPTINAEARVNVRDGRGFCSTTTKDFAAGDRMFVYYPRNGANDAHSASSVEMTIPTLQRQKEAGLFAVENMPMVSTPELLAANNSMPHITMRPLAGFLRVNIYTSGEYGDEKVQSVAYDESDTPLAGRFTLDISNIGDEASLTLSKLDALSVKTSLEQPVMVATSATTAKSIYMVLAAGSYEGRLTITTDKAIYTYDNYKRTVARNTYYDINADLSKCAARTAIAGEWGGGSGSEGDPYLIATAADLELLSSRMNDATLATAYADKHYRQIADIDMKDKSIKPIGYRKDLTDYTASPTATTFEMLPFEGIYDGAGHAIHNLKITNSSAASCGLFGYIEGATLRNITILSAEVKSSHLHCGILVGAAELSTIENCSINGDISGTANTLFIEPKDSANYSSSSVGGVAGYIGNSTLSNCSYAGHLTTTSKLGGGIVAYATASTISNCTLKKEGFIDVKTDFVGGIAGRARHDCHIEDCVVDGRIAGFKGNYNGGITSNLTSGTIARCTVSQTASISSRGDHTGGIVGAMKVNEETGSRTAKIEDCINYAMVIGQKNIGGIVGYQGGSTSKDATLVERCTSYGDVQSNNVYAGGIAGTITCNGNSSIVDCISYGNINSTRNSAGGIVGYILTTGTTIVDSSIAYGNVRGVYYVGGILGNVKTNAAKSKMAVANCIYAGKRIDAIGNNGNNGYSLASGLVGWTQIASGSGYVVNCASRVEEIYTVSSYNGYPTKNNTMSGIIGFQNGSPTESEFYALYSTIDKSGFYTDNESYATHPSPSEYYAGISSKAYKSTFNYCYHNPSVVATNLSAANNTPTLGVGIEAYGSMSTLLANLNGAVNAYTGNAPCQLKQWVLDSDGYPVIEGMTTYRPKSTQKRISVIGDSISTYMGIVPSGYACHYPTADGDLRSVSQTYWWRLAYDLMLDATIDRNIAYSGTAVARTTDTKYADNYWYGNDFCARYIAHNGMGDPDIILIHGGTNDYAHNCDMLAPDVAMRSTTRPADSIMESMYAAADAVGTLKEAYTLNDTTFCEAYIKLLRMMRLQYGDVKIVCIIGDYLTTGIQQATHHIASHYGAKVVDLYAVNGYNDQTYMPKHDYNPSTGKGCHPSSKAMEFIANKIYNELGSWLEE